MKNENEMENENTNYTKSGMLQKQKYNIMPGNRY